MRAKVILVVATTAAALLSAIYAGSEALARGGGGGRGGHGGMMSASRGFGSHGMNGHMNGHMNRFAFKGQHLNNFHDMRQNKGNRGKFTNMQGMWQRTSQRNNNIQGQWQVSGGGGGGGSIGDLCVGSGVCQGVWQVAPQSESHTSQSRNFQRSWHVGDEM